MLGASDPLTTNRFDTAEDLFDVRDHAFVFHPVYEQPASCEHAVAVGIVVGPAVVRSTVRLHDQCGGVAVKVGDEAVDDLLSAEVKAAELVPPEACPNGEFGRRQVSPEFSGALGLAVFDPLTAHDVRGGCDRERF